MIELFVGLVILVFFASRVLKASKGGKSKPRTKPEIQTDNRVFLAQVHGIRHRNADGTSRQKIISQCRVGEELELVPEPTNRYDDKAVKICRRNGQQLGYWRGDGRMADDLARGHRYRVTINEIYPFAENSRSHGVQLRVEVLE